MRVPATFDIAGLLSQRDGQAPRVAIASEIVVRSPGTGILTWSDLSTTRGSIATFSTALWVLQIEIVRLTWIILHTRWAHGRPHLMRPHALRHATHGPWPKHRCWADHIWFCCTLAIAVNGALQQSSRTGGRVAGLFTQDGHHTDWDWEQHPNSHGGDSCKQFERGKILLELPMLDTLSNQAPFNSIRVIDLKKAWCFIHFNSLTQLQNIWPKNPWVQNKWLPSKQNQNHRHRGTLHKCQLFLLQSREAAVRLQKGSFWGQKALSRGHKGHKNQQRAFGRASTSHGTRQIATAVSIASNLSPTRDLIENWGPKMGQFLPRNQRHFLSHKKMLDKTPCAIGNLSYMFSWLVYHLNLNINQKILLFWSFFGEENTMRHEALDFVVEVQVLIAPSPFPGSLPESLRFHLRQWSPGYGAPAQTIEWPGVCYSIDV